MTEDVWGEQEPQAPPEGPAATAGHQTDVVGEPAPEDVWGDESGPTRAARARRPRRERRKGNTPADMAGAARAATLAEATGQIPAEADDWRERLAGGERSVAEAAVRSKALTHNAGSGFGLA